MCFDFSDFLHPLVGYWFLKWGRGPQQNLRGFQGVPSKIYKYHKNLFCHFNHVDWA